MELEGLKRCIKTLESNEINIGTLVTDRHTQIKKFLKTQHQGINHYFDVFHVAKSMFEILMSIIPVYHIFIFSAT